MTDVVVDTLWIFNVCFERGILMTSCRSDVKRICRRNARTSHAEFVQDSWCGCVVATSAAN